MQIFKNQAINKELILSFFGQIHRIMFAKKNKDMNLEEQIISIVSNSNPMDTQSRQKALFEVYRICHAHLFLMLKKDRNMEKAANQIIKSWDIASARLKKQGFTLAETDHIRQIFAQKLFI